jgi:hypothetical protein
MGTGLNRPDQLVITDALRSTINKVAQFCASNGTGVINVLKNKAEAMTMMPFLFEGTYLYIYLSI